MCLLAAACAAQTAVRWTPGGSTWQNQGVEWRGLNARQITVWANIAEDSAYYPQYLKVQVYITNQSNFAVTLQPDKSLLVTQAKTYKSLPLSKLRRGPSLFSKIAVIAGNAGAGYEHASHPTRTETSDGTLTYPNGQTVDVEIERQVPIPAPTARPIPQSSMEQDQYNAALAKNLLRPDALAAKSGPVYGWMFFRLPKKLTGDVKICIDGVTFEFPWKH
jgi:hypothetical protein